MNYEKFKTKVKQEFMSYLPEEYQHLRMDIRPVEKVNVIKNGISFMEQGRKTWISPTIYVEDLYRSYQESRDYKQVFEKAATTVCKLLKEPFMKNGINVQNAKDNIVFQLINTEQNKGLLNSMPHREFHDLSIIYRWVVGIDESDVQSMVVKNDLSEKLGFNEEQMFKLAVENYKRLFPTRIFSLDEIAKKAFVEEGMPEKLAEIMFPNQPEEETMWIITNSAKINGAASMLYDDTLQKIAERVKSDLYILPSSVHETIAVSVNMGNPDELAQMVNEVNMNNILLEERLSNQVYHYDKELHKLTMATDTPMKRLDGLVADSQLIYSSDARAR